MYPNFYTFGLLQLQTTTKTYSGALLQQKTTQIGPKHILPAGAPGRTITKLEVDAQVSMIIISVMVSIVKNYKKNTSQIYKVL